MIRKSITVKKEKVFDFLEDPLVSKIEIKRDGNMSREDKSIIKIYIYKNTDKKLLREFRNNLVGVVKKKNEENNWVSLENRDYLAGLVSTKFLKDTCIERLKEIEVEEDINLSIPHALKST